VPPTFPIGATHLLEGMEGFCFFSGFVVII
jgi:hypothetical protein